MRSQRPDITDEMVATAAEEVARQLRGGKVEMVAKRYAEMIVEHYTYPMDGYHLARLMDGNPPWCLTAADVQDLDQMDNLVGRMRQDAERGWAKEHFPQPPLPVGAQIKEGRIVGIDEGFAATYVVQPPNHLEPSFRHLVRFEDAIVL